MNPSEFERTKPTQTFAALDSAIAKYRQMVNEHTYNGQQLLMESNDAQRVALAQQVVSDLENIKRVFLTGS
jgi:hypothetical protein|tara:strand:- start:452 stop:664 length:213 start_codon:yes stop_codon:yes gene_type:complete